MAVANDKNESSDANNSGQEVMLQMFWQTQIGGMQV